MKDEYEDQKNTTDNIRRGLLFEKIIGKLFKNNGFEIVESFRRRRGGEQIDGACKYDGCYYLIECKWQEELSNIRDTDNLSMKVSRSGTNTRGLFISVNGWSGHVVPALRENPNKNIILINGSDIEYVLNNHVDLVEMIAEKDKHLSVFAEPYFDAANML